MTYKNPKSSFLTPVIESTNIVNPPTPVPATKERNITILQTLFPVI